MAASDRVVLRPATESEWLGLRVFDITSTESSALFGLSPYKTAFEVWHEKKAGEVVTIEDSDRLKWGRRLQHVVAAGLAEDRGWMAEPMPEYIRLTDSRMGASFDWKMIDAAGRIGVFEIKTVDSFVFNNNWHEEEGVGLTAPDQIELQLQHQLHVSDYEWGAIGVLVGGNTPKVLIRERDRAVGAAIEAKVRQFWASIDANQPPAPDFAKDAELLRKLYRHAEPGSLYDARGNSVVADLCARRVAASAAEKAAKDEKEACTAELLTIIGSAERALVDGYSVSAGVVAEAPIEAYIRKGYRNLRVTAKKPARV